MKVRSGSDALFGGSRDLAHLRPAALQVDAQPRVHGRVDEIDDEIDDDEQQSR